MVIFEYAQDEHDCMICLWLNGQFARILESFDGEQDYQTFACNFQAKGKTVRCLHNSKVMSQSNQHNNDYTWQ